MKDTLRFILISLIIFIVQALTSNYLNISVYVHICLLPAIILSLPYRYKTIRIMVIAFLIGLGLDLMTDGILGLNAAALTAMAFTRNFFLSRLVNEKNVDINDVPRIKVMGFGPFSAYVFLSCLVLFLIYIPLETMSFDHFIFKLIRIVSGVVSNTLLIIILSAAIKFRRD